MIRLLKLQRSQRHGGDLGVVRILNDGQAAVIFDLGQPTRAIVIGAGQQYSGQGGTVGVGGRLKQIVDRWP